MKDYRLREGERVIGYAKETEEGIVYKAYNDFHWTSKRFHFDTVDRSIGIKDKKHRIIFEYDIVLYKLNDSEILRRGLVLISSENQEAEILDLKQDFNTKISIGNYNLFEQDKLEVVSHAFGNYQENKIEL